MSEQTPPRLVEAKELQGEAREVQAATKELPKATLAMKLPTLGGADVVAPPSDSIRGVALTGWLILAVFFGGLGTWAATAPLNGAVMAQGVVKVEGNRKSVQHLDGGIVKEMHVKEGDRVKAGDVLFVLDDTQARAEYEVLSQSYIVLRATEIRLLTELGGGASMTMSPELAAQRDDAYVVGIWAGQVKQFESRLSMIGGQRSVIGEKIQELEAQMRGPLPRAKSYSDQIDLRCKVEADSIRPLVDKGLIAKSRLTQLDRSAFQLEGQIADAQASISKNRQAIAEQRYQIAQLEHDQMTDITKDLRDTQSKLLETIPKALSARAVLGRMDIKSPYTGQVVALNVFSVGGVINRGDKILDIVPEQDILDIEAQVAVEDIAEVHPDMRAEVRLTAYKQRITPMVHGDVVAVSADRLMDPKKETPYYTAIVRLDAKELAELPNVHLYPGMPASVMITTQPRTALDYLMSPLTSSFHNAFRQK